MHDPFLKSVFADRRMIEILIRDHVPEWANEIDFSTLREEPTELVSKKTLQRRHPDMIWSADTADGGRVVFLVEFQREVERLMALRTTTYTALALERIVGIRSRGAGLEDGQGPDTVSSSLDGLIGTWSRAEADEMEQALQHFEAIDEAAWE